jgi:hypothetical protein
MYHIHSTPNSVFIFGEAESLYFSILYRRS